jgi:hypothetical protein
MYESYNGVKSSLTSDDISGIQSIYGVRQQDSFDASDPNETKSNATVITSYIDSNKQVTLTGLDLTTVSDVDWYKIKTPSGNSGTMEVRIQSTSLSLLAPKLMLYKGSTLKGTVSGDYNSTITLSESIGSGQTWYVKVEGADSSAFGIGTYAMQVNMGTAQLPVVSGPDTATPVTGPGGSGSPVVGGDHHHDQETGHHGGESDIAIAGAMDSSSSDSSAGATDMVITPLSPSDSSPQLRAASQRAGRVILVDDVLEDVRLRDLLNRSDDFRTLLTSALRPTLGRRW